MQVVLPSHEPDLVSNIVPVAFSQETFQIGHLPWTSEEAYRELREEHWRTHAFRFDQRYNEILNVALIPGTSPLGWMEEVAIGEHLLLAARAVQQAILIWIATKLPVLKSGNKRLLFLGQADEALLLSKALEKAGLRPIPDLEVSIRYEIDCRLFYDREDNPFLGLVIDVGTTNVIDLSVAELRRRGMSVTDRYVCRRQEDAPAYLRPRLELIGRVSAVQSGRLLLTDTAGEDVVAAEEALLEPRLENLEATVQALCGQRAPTVLATLRSLRQPVVSAIGRLSHCRQTVDRLKKRGLVIANGVAVQLGDLLDDRDDRFPNRIVTQRPGLLFGAQGHNPSLHPDEGIRSFGPYMFMQHIRNAPLLAVVCEAQHRGTVEQFLKLLCNGYPDVSLRGKGENPFRGGLIGKFRLGRVRLEFEETTGAEAADYRSAARRLLARLAETPDLAFVQTREAFKRYRGNDNPYFVAKAAFMAAGVPMQAVFLEKMARSSYELPYLLNNVALACYAKLDGTPWIISTRGTTTHELIVGIGTSEIIAGRLGGRERYVGITTVFQGDGRYLLWSQTRAVTVDDYPVELLASLRTAIRYVETQHGWEVGDHVRLVCHVYKRLKNAEVDAIKALVRELLADRFEVEFAFLDVSSAHPFRLFAPKELGTTYGPAGGRRRRGKGLPDRGICLQLDQRRALLHLIGPRDVKTEEQGLPQPLLLELHPDSDFTDLAYLARQAYHFIYASWKSFTPATEPVTIMYSRLIAGLLGNLRRVEGWDSTTLTVGGLRGRCWFL